MDEKLAKFVVSSHFKSHPDFNPDEENEDVLNDLDTGMDDGPPPIEQKLLKKYITYAKTCIRPVLHNVDSEKVCYCAFRLVCNYVLLFFY